jgi:hypothetical protein
MLGIGQQLEWVDHRVNISMLCPWDDVGSYSLKERDSGKGGDSAGETARETQEEGENCAGQ